MFFLIHFVEQIFINIGGGHGRVYSFSTSVPIFYFTWYVSLKHGVSYIFLLFNSFIYLSDIFEIMKKSIGIEMQGTSAKLYY